MEQIADYQIIISKRAEHRLDNIINYLENEWNERVKLDFINKFEKIILFLSINPFMFPIFIEENKIRKCFITKHNAIYYSINNNIVKIIAIYDTRQNPKSLNLL